jgi:hypothetical protein
MAIAHEMPAAVPVPGYGRSSYYEETNMQSDTKRILFSLLAFIMSSAVYAQGGGAGGTGAAGGGHEETRTGTPTTGGGAGASGTGATEKSGGTSQKQQKGGAGSAAPDSGATKKRIDGITLGVTAVDGAPEASGGKVDMRVTV